MRKLGNGEKQILCWESRGRCSWVAWAWLYSLVSINAKNLHRCSLRSRRRCVGDNLPCGTAEPCCDLEEMKLTLITVRRIIRGLLCSSTCQMLSLLSNSTAWNLDLFFFGSLTCSTLWPQLWSEKAELLLLINRYKYIYLCDWGMSETSELFHLESVLFWICILSFRSQSGKKSFQQSSRMGKSSFYKF